MKVVKRGETTVAYPNQEGYSVGTELRTWADARKVPTQIIFSPVISAQSQ